MQTLPLLLALALALAAPARKAGVATGALRSDASTGAPDCAVGYPCHMLYYGGHVIPNAKVYIVNWTAGVASDGDLATFYDTLLNSNYLDWLAEYATTGLTTAPPAGSPGTNQLVGRGVYAGAITITPSAANAGGTSTCATTTSTSCCPAAANVIPGFTCLTDAQIKGEIEAQIVSGVLPAPDLNSLYMTHFPPKYFITDPGGSFSCRGGGFCGYHGTVKDASREFYYGVIPDHGPDSGGCDVGCGAVVDFDALTSTSSHEVVEAITDPEVGVGTDSLLGWYDPGDNDKHQNGEVADVCGAFHAQVGGFTVQSVYSNLANLCVPSRVAASDFAVFLQANKKVLAGGTSATVHVSTSTTGTSSTPVSLTLAVAGLPPHVTGSFDNTAISSGGGATLTLTADGSAVAVPGTVVQITATAGSNVHTAGLLLVVVPPGASTASDFGISLSTAAVPVMQGLSAVVTVLTTPAAGVPETVTFSAPVLNGLAASFTPASAIAGGITQLTLTADSAAAIGTQVAFTISGASASASHTTSGTVTIVAPPGPPTAHITAPAEGATVSGTAEVDATATPGTGATLFQVRLLVDGVKVATADTSPAALSWDTTKATNGSHALVAESVDSNGNVGDSPVVNVKVENAPPAPPPSQKGGCAAGGGGITALLGLFALRRRRRA